MTSRRAISTVLAALLACGTTPARATDSHDYARDEYAVIRDGLAPDKHLSQASHGDGEGGNENFHVWLMAEPAHRRIARLADIGPVLDTGPNAYYAFWSADSRHVVITFRSDRHMVELNLYHIENRRAHLMLGRSLFKEVTSREVGADDHQRESIPEFEWKDTRRFVLKERRRFVTSGPGFERMLGAFGRVTDKLDDGRLMIEFSAEADCLLMPGDRYRIVDLRTGKFGN
ncbi:MAG: hypothetical protein E8A46_29380 [Bradyrhizobium sp.]|uniref:hypothetical protein n=1 Tax=Bradyrhizobium sp. TaxID=376 RepID=UPI0011F712DA|nr:hypothetical protein [Bradyrhizobium sp.]THD45123.1 MAG: hypothetical protein E8A46_29380 [Bradyrhizobium sp.]